MLRWNAQHGSLRRPSARAFHPVIVSGVLLWGTSSCGSGVSSPLAGEQFAREDLQSLTLKRYAGAWPP